MKKGWEYKKLGEVATYINGYPFKPSDWKECGKPIIRIQNLTGTQLNFNRCPRTDIPEKYIVTRGDILISWSATLGVFEWKSNDALLNQHIFKVVFDKVNINKQYFQYAIIMSISEMKRHTNGATMKHIRKGDFDNIKIPVPSLSEQKEIVEYLDSSFAKIDKLKENAAKNLEEAKALFQSALKDALEPKEGWEEKTLKDVCTHIVDCPHSTPPKSSVPTEFPFIRTSDLKQGKISWDVMQYVSKEEYIKRNARITPQKDDIIYGREGTFGDAVLLPDYPYFCLGQRVVLLRPDKNIFNPQFMLYLVISPFVYSQAKDKNMGCGVGHVNVADIKKFRLSFPPLSEQQSIVSHLDSLNEKVNTLQQNYSRICDECDALKQAILRQVFE